MKIEAALFQRRLTNMFLNAPASAVTTLLGLGTLNSSRSSFGAVHWLLLLAILLIAGLLRFWNLTWHLPATLHPDEHNIVLYALRFGTGDLNPHFFLYGSLLMYLAFSGYGVYFAIGYLARIFPSTESFAIEYFLDPTWFYLIPRMISAAAGTATVWLAYLLGSRVFSARAGLFSAAGMALYADHVRESHYVMPAVLAAFFCAAVFAKMVNPAGGASNGKLRLFGLGVLGGLAVSAYLLAFIATVIVGLWLVWQHRHNVVGAIRALSVTAAGSVAGFFLGEPFFFLDFQNAYRSILSWVEGRWYSNPQLQTFINILWDIRANFGWVGAALVIGGILVAGRRRLPVAVAFLAGAAGYLVLLAYHGYAPSRYVLMIVPILCLFLGIGAVALLDWARRWRWRLPVHLVVAVLAIAITAEPATRAFQATRSFGAPDTRVLAQQWVYKNIRAGARLLLDGADAHLPRLLENPERLRELKSIADSVGTGASVRYKQLAEYFRYKALAAEKAEEPTYWILRRKQAWWAHEGKEALGVSRGLAPPTAHMSHSSLREYQGEYGIRYVISTSLELRAYDNSRFPSTQRFYADLRRFGKLVHVEEPGPVVTGPRIYVWEVRG